ncbi:MAG: DNA polymerase III subunit chi [Gammaproteobacteria bacterium]|nr:DNA polymerase III subunit chi [Gammaproteobacteria bacterium]
MARVDFYILPEQGDQDRRRFACALTQKAWKAGNRVCLLVGDREQAGELDNLLWTFRDISFVPHALADSQEAATVPVIIGWEDSGDNRDSTASAEVLINLAGRIPSATSKFDRIAEIVGGSAGERQSARDLYREYRSQGTNFTITT